MLSTPCCKIYDPTLCLYSTCMGSSACPIMAHEVAETTALSCFTTRVRLHVGPYSLRASLLGYLIAAAISGYPIV